MAFAGGDKKIVQCPKCLCPDTQKGKSGGTICRGCGHWW